MLPLDRLIEEEIAEVREVLARRRWWRQTWTVLRTLHDRLKLLTGLAPWVFGAWYFREHLLTLVRGVAGQ